MADGILTKDKIYYYQKTVPYVVGGRRYIGDPVGFVLTNGQPWVAVREGDLRDFKIANKSSLVNGLIVETEEPSVDWETANTFTDEELIKFLAQPVSKVRKELDNITSVATLARMLNTAKDKRKSEQMVDAIQARLEEVDDEIVEMKDIERAVDA